MSKHPGGRPLKFKTPEELEAKGKAYFKACDKNSQPYTITGLALSLGTTRQTLLEYEGEVEGREEKSKEFADTVKKLKTIVEEYAERMMYLGKNAAGPIFALKNFGWSDKQEIDHTTKGKPLPPSILANLNVSNHDGDKENRPTQEED